MRLGEGRWLGFRALEAPPREGCGDHPGLRLSGLGLLPFASLSPRPFELRLRFLQGTRRTA